MNIKKLGVCGPIEGVCAQFTILATNGQYSRPLVYLQRPKWICNDAQWAEICHGITLILPKDFEVCE